MLTFPVVPPETMSPAILHAASGWVGTAIANLRPVERDTLRGSKVKAVTSTANKCSDFAPDGTYPT